MRHVPIAVSTKKAEGAILKYRICYQKNDPLIFISHLDLQKTFQRSFRRAKIRLAYSEGFSPHPKMTYSPPLSLFVSSAQEYLDIELNTALSVPEIEKRLRENLPESLVINSVKQLQINEPSLADLIGWGEYEIKIYLPSSNPTVCKDIEEYYHNSESILIEKKNKKKQLVKKDIKPSIRSLSCTLTGENLLIRCELSLSNDTLLNPHILATALIGQIPSLAEAKILSVRKIKISVKTEEQK